MKKNIFLYQLSEFFNVYLPEVRRASKNTISSYADSFAVFFEFLYEQKKVQHTHITYKLLSPKLFDEYVVWMTNSRKYSSSSIRQRLAALSSFLKYASRREMQALPAYTTITGIDGPKKSQSEFPYFTLEEMHILLALPNPNKYLGERDLVFLSLLYDTGARAQEICDLQVTHIRFGKPTKVKLQGKGGKIREVPISEEVSNLLIYHFKQNNFEKNQNIPLFSSQTHSKMTTACVRGIVNKYVTLAKAGHSKMFAEKHYSPHSFRHSKAVHMVEAGVNLIYIRNFLGHASISSTEIYARVSQAAVNKALTERNIPKVSATAPKSNNIGCSMPKFITENR